MVTSVVLRAGLISLDSDALLKMEWSKVMSRSSALNADSRSGGADIITHGAACCDEGSG